MAPEIACLTRGMTRHQLCEHGVRRGARDAPRGPHGIPDAELPSLHACQETRDVTAWRHTGEEAVRERGALTREALITRPERLERGDVRRVERRVGGEPTIGRDKAEDPTARAGFQHPGFAQQTECSGHVPGRRVRGLGQGHRGITFGGRVRTVGLGGGDARDQPPEQWLGDAAGGQARPGPREIVRPAQEMALRHPPSRPPRPAS